MDIFTLLLNPKVLAILGPVGIMGLAVIYGNYKMWKWFFTKYDEIQNKRIEESHDMQKEYFELAKEVDKTLDILIKTISRKGNNGPKNE